MFDTNPLLYNRLLYKVIMEIGSKTGFGIVFTHRDDLSTENNIFTPKSNFCGFCNEMSKWKTTATLCLKDHKKRGLNGDTSKIVSPCHAGLYNNAVAIKVDNEVVASVLIGQRKIEGRESESKNLFSEFIKKINLSVNSKKLLESKFNEIPVVDEKSIGYQALLKIKDYIDILSYILSEEKHNKIRMNSIVHEILLPMQAIIINAENLKDETYSSKVDFEFLKEASTKILFEVNSLNLYVENLRRILRMAVLKPSHEYRPVYVYRLIEQSTNRFVEHANEKGIIIKSPTYTLKKFPTINLVEDEFIIALNNIYANAVKYSYSSSLNNPKREIITECFNKTIDGVNYFVIEVSNFGVGILDSEITSGDIFKAGYRGKLSMDRNRTGSGVGLYLIRHIIEELHSGKLEVRSIDKNSGFLTTMALHTPLGGNDVQYFVG